MRHIGLVLVMLLVFPAMARGMDASCANGACQGAASSQELAYGAAELKMPANVYTALLEMPALLAQQKTLKERGFDLTAEELQRLTSYKQAVKGLIMVEIGFPSCAPCRVLFKELIRAESSSSVLQQWQNKGGRFYQIDWTQDARSRSGKNLSTLWEVQTVPVLLFFKDGEITARLNGINVQNPSSTMAQIKAHIEAASR